MPDILPETRDYLIVCQLLRDLRQRHWERMHPGDRAEAIRHLREALAFAEADAGTEATARV